METELAQTLPIMTKSKLDKAQARRLKMPKRNRSAYFLFSMDTRAKLKTEYSNNLTPLEMQGKVSQYWKDLSFEEKEKYEQRARDEKVEYLAAMEKFYSSLTPETLEKSKSNKPKKPCSAYAHFVHDIKTELKKDNPKLIMQEILHIVSDKWKNIDEPTRALYEERARIDKEQYMTAIKKYNLDSQESPEPTSTVSEKPIVKKVKLETISTRAESQGEVEEQTVRLVKIEEVQDFSNASGSPTTIRITPETTIMPQMTMIEPVFLPQSIQGLQGLQMPGLNVKMQPNMYPNQMMFGGEKMKEMMLAKLSWARFMEANNNLEHAIAKRIAEVRNLQAQQYMFAQKVFLASNTGPF